MKELDIGKKRPLKRERKARRIKLIALVFFGIIVYLTLKQVF